MVAVQQLADNSSLSHIHTCADAKIKQYNRKDNLSYLSVVYASVDDSDDDLNLSRTRVSLCSTTMPVQTWGGGKQQHGSAKVESVKSWSILFRYFISIFSGCANSSRVQEMLTGLFRFVFYDCTWCTQSKGSLKFQYPKGTFFWLSSWC